MLCVFGDAKLQECKAAMQLPRNCNLHRPHQDSYYSILKIRLISTRCPWQNAVFLEDVWRRVHSSGGLDSLWLFRRPSQSSCTEMFLHRSGSRALDERLWFTEIQNVSEQLYNWIRMFYCFLNAKCTMSRTRYLIYTNIHKYTHTDICVCNIWIDVKLLTLNFCRGVRHDCGTALNEATTIMGYWVWSTQRTCHFNHRFAMFRPWQPAKPRTGTSTNWSFQFFARFSQSELPLSFEDEWAASERVVWFPSHRFSLLIFHLLLSSLTEVFLHVRCIPHQ